MQTAFPNKIRIATRESLLALWQAEHVAKRLKALAPQTDIELIKIKTKGDKFLNTALTKIGGKGLFIKELEVAMIEGEADLAVHSMKDVGVSFPDGFTLAAILQRENPFDAFVSNHYAKLTDLPQGAKVGTCSLRRRMQLHALRPDLDLIDLRGNIHTRLRKLDEGQYDAIILACAGLIRMEMPERITEQLAPTLSLPAIGQGAIGVECREDSALLPLIAKLNDADTALCVKTERIINQRLEGNCQVPIAAYATLEADNMHLEAKIGTPDGKQVLSYAATENVSDAHALGEAAADALIAQGALDILHALKESD